MSNQKTPATPAAAPITPSTTEAPWSDATFSNLGMNVKYRVENNILFLAVPISAATIANARPSSTGKSKTVGSTLGNQAIPGFNVKVGLNVYSPNVATA